MYGWHLKILRVNLTTRTATQEDVDPKIARDYLGGRGWAIHYLYKDFLLTIQIQVVLNFLY